MPSLLDRHSNDGEEVVDECWENQRYSPFSGWGATSNALDRPSWSTKKGDKVVCREAFLLPVGWSWISSWNVEPHKDNIEGWYYAPDFSISTKYCSTKQSKLSMVRRRRWVRTRRNCQTELEYVASVRSLKLPSPQGSVLSHNSSGAWLNVPEPKVFVPEFCFRFSTWVNTACYGFSGASPKALVAEQDRCHHSFLKLQSLLATTEFFDNQGSSAFSNSTTPTPSHTNSTLEQPSQNQQHPATTSAERDSEFGSPTTSRSNGAGGPSSPKNVKLPPLPTTVSDKSLSYVYRYGVAPVLRRHLWVSWSGAGAKKAANSGLFQRLSKEAIAIVEKGHKDGTNEMLAEILQDVVRTAPRHPFFEHSQVLGLMKTKKTLASSVTAPQSPPRTTADGLEVEPESPNSTSGGSDSIQQTTLSGAIANNNIANHSGGFINDNSGSYRLTLTLVCLSLYEKEQAAYKKSVEAALAAASEEGGGSPHSAKSPANPFKKVPEYHQAFSYVAALLLLNMPEEEAFWTLVCLLEDFLPVGYHDAFQMNTDLRVLSEVIRERIPQLDANFNKHQVDVSVFASGWLQGLFCAHFPFPTAARILDILFAEGNSSILIRTIFAFVRLNKSHFLAEDSSCGAGQFANTWARECFDLDEVIANVVNDNKTFDLMNVTERRRRELYNQV